MLGSVLSTGYRAQLTSAAPEEAAAGDVSAASETISGASVVAERIGGPVGTELWASAQSAFADAVSLTGFLTAALVLITAILVWIILRRDRSPQGTEE